MEGLEAPWRARAVGAGLSAIVSAGTGHRAGYAVRNLHEVCILKYIPIHTTAPPARELQQGTAVQYLGSADELNSNLGSGAATSLWPVHMDSYACRHSKFKSRSYGQLYSFSHEDTAVNKFTAVDLP
eukprot:SAG31_NODE_2109_length_6426_cov_13.928244_10_plen_127_part_00